MARTKTPKANGRPTDYSNALVETICQRMAEGESLRAICRDPKMPDQATVFRWLADERYTSFREQYAHARDARADAIFDEMLEIADTPKEGTKRKKLADGKSEVTTGDMVEHRRLQVDTRKWILARMAPKKYGDKIEMDTKLTHSVDNTVVALMEAINGKTRAL